MRLSAVMSCVLGACSVLGAAGDSAAGEPRRTGWYVGGGVGADWPSTMKQVGHNRDTLCYPDNDCSHLPGGMPSGYRWRYKLEPDAGVAFEAAVGRMFGPWRVELSAAQRTSDIDQKLSGIGYLDGKPIRSAGNDIRSNAMASIDDLMTRTLSLSLYYDFPRVADCITPYLGGGLGVAFVELSDLRFHTDYTGTRRPSDLPLPSLASRQDVDLSDIVLAKHLYAGADYSLTDKTLLGLKLAYTWVDDIEDRSGYSSHPVEGLTSLTKISGMDHWTLMVTVKYRFGK